MQFFAGISRNTQSKSYTATLTKCVWGFQNNALWDTREHALLGILSSLHDCINKTKHNELNGTSLDNLEI